MTRKATTRKINTLSRLLVLALVPMFAFSSWVAATDGANELGKRPLDLPSGSFGGAEEEEDSPERIQFYGAEFEGDGFFWCFPAYSFCGDTTVFTLIKQEITESMAQLSERSEMSLVAYSTETFVWSHQAKRASSNNRSNALAWMNTLQPQSSQCLLEAGLTTINITNSCHKESKQMIFLGGNTPYCGSGGNYAEMCLEQITSANYEGTPINTFYIAAVYQGGQAFWQELAAMNNGAFQQVY